MKEVKKYMDDQGPYYLPDREVVEIPAWKGGSPDPL